MNLTGKRILVTRPRAQAERFGDALKIAGAQPIFFPVIKIISPESYCALDSAIRNLQYYDWLILTSVPAVDVFLRRMNSLGIRNIPPTVRVAAVGTKTAQCLSEHHVRANYVPDEYLSATISSGFGNNMYEKRFLLPQSNLASNVLADEIRHAGGFVTEVVACSTVTAEPVPHEIDALRAGVDVITFTSPSTVQNFSAILKQHGQDPFHLPKDPRFACIGPVTEQAAREEGFDNLIVAREYTTDGLIAAIANMETL